MAAILLGGAWTVVQIVRPPAAAIVEPSAADGFRAQQKLFEFSRRSGGRPQTLALSEAEVNAFLRRHLASEGDLPLRRPTVRLVGGARTEIIGQIGLGQLLALSPFSMLRRVLPSSALEREVWLTVRAHVTVENSDA